MIWREATRGDVPAVVALLADDVLGRSREGGAPDVYLDAFDRMQAEGANHLIVAENAGRVVACYQLTLISGLSLTAARRAQVEGVRVAADLRGKGVGAALMNRAITAARDLGYRLVLLVGDAPYYQRFGFRPVPFGKLSLPGPVDPARFLVLELSEGALAAAAGPVVPRRS